MEPITDQRNMELRPCRVEACGAKVIVADVGGRNLALNPVWTAIAVPAEGGRFAIVQGYQPHAYTCVDITGRRQFLADLRSWED